MKPLPPRFHSLRLSFGLLCNLGLKFRLLARCFGLCSTLRFCFRFSPGLSLALCRGPLRFSFGLLCTLGLKFRLLTGCFRLGTTLRLCFRLGLSLAFPFCRCAPLRLDPFLLLPLQGHHPRFFSRLCGLPCRRPDRSLALFAR